MRMMQCCQNSEATRKKWLDEDAKRDDSYIELN